LEQVAPDGGADLRGGGDSGRVPGGDVLGLEGLLQAQVKEAVLEGAELDIEVGIDLALQAKAVLAAPEGLDRLAAGGDYLVNDGSVVYPGREPGDAHALDPLLGLPWQCSASEVVIGLWAMVL
jgi:hypothetical protein